MSWFCRLTLHNNFCTLGFEVRKLCIDVAQPNVTAMSLELKCLGLWRVFLIVKALCSGKLKNTIISLFVLFLSRFFLCFSYLFYLILHNASNFKVFIVYCKVRHSKSRTQSEHIWWMWVQLKNFVQDRSGDSRNSGLLGTFPEMWK